MRSSSRSSILVGALAVSILVTGAYLGLGGRDERAVRRRIDRAIAVARPTAGRLANRPYSPVGNPPTLSADLTEAGRILQRIPPDSESREPLDAYLKLAHGAWMDAAEIMEDLLTRTPDDASLINDLGVVYLELGTQEPSYLPAAFQKFETAAQLDPRAPAPLFNLVLAYDALHLDQGRREAEATYRALAPGDEPAWPAELVEGPTRTRSAEFENALKTGNIRLASRQFEQDPDVFWRFLSTEVLNPLESGLPEPAFLLDLARDFEQTRGDATPRMMLEPMLGPHALEVGELRRSVRKAQGAYETLGTAEVLAILRQNRSVASMVESDFDRLWLDLNEAEALAWSGDIETAEQLLEDTIEAASDLDLKWILADALTRYSDQRYVTGRIDAFERLTDAVRIYEEIGAGTASVRPRLFLAIYYQLEGSSRLSFDAAQEALRLTAPTDTAALHNLFWILGRNPQSQGRLRFAYPKQAAIHAESAGASARASEAYFRLAELYAETDEREQAARHLDLAADAAARLGPETRRLSRLAGLLTEGKISAMQDAYGDAERAFLRGIALLPEGTTRYGSAYHLELATLYARRGRSAEAREQFALGLDAVESEDNLLGPLSRLAFDEERRRYYEAAIAFEYSQGDALAAWLAAQHYRNKLWTDAFDRNGTSRTSQADVSQPRIPEGGAVIEFTVLRDQLLIWVSTPRGLEVTSVTVSRAEVESRIETMRTLVGTRDRTGQLEMVSRELDEMLIAPVESLIAEAEWISIVPDRMLHQLPFAALTDAEGLYLVERFPLLQTPEVSYLFTDTAPTTSENAVVFGSRVPDRGTRAEIEGIGQIYPGRSVFDGFEVTADSFLENVAGADLFVYAGHSAVDGDNSLSSAILLDGVRDSDHVVTALEIADQTLAPNALVVLSSCDSSIGNNVGGVEFRGLTSAFLVAGAGSVVGSLWPVESMETADLMIDFHERVSRRIPIAIALADAQRRMIRDGLHAFYWAGFTITGNASALEAARFLASADL